MARVAEIGPCSLFMATNRFADARARDFTSLARADEPSNLKQKPCMKQNQEMSALRLTRK